MDKLFCCVLVSQNDFKFSIIVVPSPFAVEESEQAYGYIIQVYHNSTKGIIGILTF